MTEARIACEQCGNPVSESVIVCPHCAHERVAGKRWQEGLSSTEARAILALQHRHEGKADSPGLWRTLVFPHEQTRGNQRRAELALTAVGLPLVLASMFYVIFLPLRYQLKILGANSSELSRLGFTLLTGGLSLWGLLSRQSVPLATLVGGVCSAALIVRAIVRARTEHRSSDRDLFLASGPEPSATLPSARLISSSKVSQAPTPRPARSGESLDGRLEANDKKALPDEPSILT